MNKINCFLCGKAIEEKKENLCNHSQDTKGNKFCLECSEFLELTELNEKGKGHLYLCFDEIKNEKGEPLKWRYVQTFAGMEKMRVTYYKKSKGYGFGRSYDIETFSFIGPDSKAWHGKVMGDQQLARVARYKEGKK